MSKYDTLIDAETWAFIERTNSHYPSDTATRSIEEQRAIYDAMCRAFFVEYPEGVTATDTSFGDIPIRQYTSSNIPAAHVVYYHGGGFVVGGLESHDDVCAEICAQTGFDVTSVDYRLAPEHVFPADFQDAMGAFEWVAEAFAGPIILVGDSAGGNLVAAVSQAARKRARQPVGQVLIYPGLGRDFTKGSFVEHSEAPMLTTADILFYKDARTGGNGDQLSDPRCVPLADTDFSGLPPTVIISAECDPLSSDGETYRDAIIAAGGQAVWHNETGLVHGYLRARHSVGRARNSFAKIVAATRALGTGNQSSLF